MATQVPITLQRRSLAKMLEELAARGPAAQGVASVVIDKDGKASFRLSGFEGPMDRFVLVGLLDWIKADIMSDLL